MADVNTTLELVDSYVNTLIIQYKGKSKTESLIRLLTTAGIIAQYSVQLISYSKNPTSGTYKLSFDGVQTPTINYNATASDIQTAINFIPGLETVTVTGNSITGFSVTFTGINDVVDVLVVSSNTLFAISSSVDITIDEIDETIPLAIKNGFNLLPGYTPAIGAQLDILGKYAGVVRYGYGFDGTTQIVLDDDQYLNLIKLAVIKNNSGSSLSDITNLLFQFFGSQIIAYDNADMTMNYVIEQGVGDQNFVQIVVNEGLLPVPMAVKVSVYFYPPTGFLFSFRTAATPSSAAPFSTVTNILGYWLSAHDILGS